MGGIVGRGKIKMASASTPSVKSQLYSGKLVTSGISDVAIASVQSKITRLKKLIMIIIITEKPFTSK